MSQTNWEIFLEKIAEVLATALTDAETEAVVAAFRKFSDKIRELSR
jgi:hypothetical protein